MSKYSLLGINGNAFGVIGYVTRAMKKEGRSELEIKKYREKVMSSDYRNLLRISQGIIDSLNEKESDTNG